MGFGDWLNKQGGVVDQLREAWNAGYREGHADANKLCEPKHARDAERIGELQGELNAALDVVEIARKTCERRAPYPRAPLELALERWESRSCQVCGLRMYDPNGSVHECPPGFTESAK
jgi:hypothetical protein